jgi:hypothetical protein
MADLKHPNVRYLNTDVLNKITEARELALKQDSALQVHKINDLLNYVLEEFICKRRTKQTKQ